MKETFLIYFLIWNSLLLVFFLIYRIGTNRRHKKENSLKEKVQEALTKSLIETEEKEKARVARELYEGIGQQLSATKINISVLQNFMSQTTQADRSLLNHALELLDDSVKELRVLSQSMVPHTLIKSGLVTAMLEYVNKTESSDRFKINLEIIGEVGRFEQTKEIVLFRVLQDLITNCVKHADATETNVQIVKHEKELSILVVDNGKGFNVEEALQREKCFGLKNTRCRVAYLKGNLFFDSRINRGTSVSIEVPLPL